MIGFQITDMTLVQGMGHQLVLITHHPKCHLEKGENFLLRWNDEVGNCIRPDSEGVKFVLGFKNALCEFLKMVIRHNWPFMSFASAYILTF